MRVVPLPPPITWTPDSMKTPTEIGPSLEARRQFIKLSTLFTAMGALPLLQRHKQARAAEPNAPVRLGYLAVTDSTPLLVANHNKLFEAQGLEEEKTPRFRSWGPIVEALPEIGRKQVSTQV